eukprot:6933698-Alexandrium_andersonii.AAC.1
MVGSGSRGQPTTTPSSLPLRRGRAGQRPRPIGRRRGAAASWRPSTPSASTGSWPPRATRAT